MSERTLHRLCNRAFGFSPKALLRQKRFLRTLERVRGVLDRPLSGLIDDGYFDQAHFNREFREFMGMTPTDYFNSPVRSCGAPRWPASPSTARACRASTRPPRRWA